VAPISLPDRFSVVVPIVAGVGNALMAVPLVRQLKTVAGAERVVVAARTNAMAEPFRRMDEVDEVVVGKARQMIQALRSTRADLLLMPFPSNRWQYSMLALASGAGQVLLHDYPVGRLRALHFVGKRVPARRGLHDVEQNLRLLRQLGVEPDLREAPRFAVHDDDRAAADMVVGRGPFIAVHAGSAQTMLAQAKRWPTTKYASLIEAMWREFGLDIVVLEGPDEAGVADAIIANLPLGAPQPRIARLVGNLGVAAAVFERAKVYVGSDSGLAHLAAAVGKRAVTIFAPADPERVCPFGNRDLVVKPAKSCSPCFLYPWQSTYPRMYCGQHGQSMCINEVTVDEVMATVRRACTETKHGGLTP